TFTFTLARALNRWGSTPAARHPAMAWATAAWSCCSVRPSDTPSPAEFASRACPSTTVMVTTSDLMGWPPLKLEAETDAWLGSGSLQVLKLPITKSESVAVLLCEERVSATKLEKHASRPRAVRLTPSSRNSPAAGPEFLLLSWKVQGTEIDEPLTMA